MRISRVTGIPSSPIAMGGEIAAVGIFATMLDHEVVVPLSLAFAPGADVCKITTVLLQAGFCLEKGYCGGVQKFFALCVQERAVWEAVSLLVECQLFPNPDLTEPVEVVRVREQLPRLYGLSDRVECHPVVSDWFLGVGQISMEVLK